MSLCPPLSSKDCNGVCNGPSILDCAGTCYNPLENPIPPHVRDCAGVCYDPNIEEPLNFYDSFGNCVDKIDCPEEPICPPSPSPGRREYLKKEETPPFRNPERHWIIGEKSLILVFLMVMVILGIMILRDDMKR
jgi:hypothetical protein